MRWRRPERDRREERAAAAVAARKSRAKPTPTLTWHCKTSRSLPNGRGPDARHPRRDAKDRYPEVSARSLDSSQGSEARLIFSKRRPGTSQAVKYLINLTLGFA